MPACLRACVPACLPKFLAISSGARGSGMSLSDKHSDVGKTWTVQQHGPSMPTNWAWSWPPQCGPISKSDPINADAEARGLLSDREYYSGHGLLTHQNGESYEGDCRETTTVLPSFTTPAGEGVYCGEVANFSTSQGRVTPMPHGQGQLALHMPSQLPQSGSTGAFPYYP